MENIATLDFSKELGRLAKLLRLMGKEGMDMESLQRPIDDKMARNNLMTYLIKKCSDFITIDDGEKLSGYNLARFILEDDFISPEEIGTVCKFPYSDNIRQHFEHSLPSEEVLLWLRFYGFTLIAGPPRSVLLTTVRDSFKEVYPFGIVSSIKNNHQFLQNNEMGSEWLMLRKTAVPNSMDKTWKQQQALISEREYVPNMTELMWGFTTHSVIRRKRLYDDVLLRTSSIFADDRRIRFEFDKPGPPSIFPDTYDPGQDKKLGVAAARKQAFNL
jgi:hypothetical protein